MPSPRQMAVVALKNLARECIREQMALKMTRAAQRQLRREAAASLTRLHQIKNRINREITQNGKLLGVQDGEDESGE